MYHRRAMDADALDLALEPGNKHASGTNTINTKCDIQDPHFYNIRITNICSLSRDSHNWNASMAQLFDWGEQTSNDPDSDQRPAKSNNFEMMSEVKAEDSDIVFISSHISDSGIRKASNVKAGGDSVDSDIVFISSNSSDSGIRKASTGKVKAGDNSMDSDNVFMSSNSSDSGIRKASTSKVKAGDNSVDSDIVFTSSHNSDSEIRKASKVKAGDDSVDSDIVFISSNNSDSEISKSALDPLDNAAKSQLSSLQTDIDQISEDTLSIDDPENLVCDTEVLECLHGTTYSKNKPQVAGSPLQKGPVVMNPLNTYIPINGAMQQVRDENKSDEDRSNVQTVKNDEESSNVFCCIFGWLAQTCGNTMQCSCESRHKGQAIDFSPKNYWTLESKDCSSVKIPTQCEVSTERGTAGMQYHCKTTSAGPWSKYTQPEGHGLLGSSSGFRSEIGTTSKKGTRTKEKKKKQAAKNRSTCVTTNKKSYKKNCSKANTHSGEITSKPPQV